MSDVVTVKLSGRMMRAAVEGNWPNDCPSGFESLKTATRSRRGSGVQYVVELSRVDAADLADYLDSLAGVVGQMSASEREHSTEHRDAAVAAGRLRAALSV